MSHLGNPCKSMIFNAKKVEKKAKKGLTSVEKPVGWTSNNEKERTKHYVKH